MSNERYKLMCICHYIAEHGYHNPILIIVSPSDQGKTDTIDIFLRDNENVYVIPGATETKQFMLLKERYKNTITWVLDEPDDWELKDLKKILMTLKHIGTGKLKPARATSFGQNPSSTICSACIILCNDEQIKTMHYILQKTGLLKRALIIMSEQNTNTINYVCDHYRQMGCKSGVKLPKFKNNMVLKDSGSITPAHQKWINKNFEGFKKSTVEWICRLVTAFQFEEFKPFLLSYYNYEMINEKIEFKGNIDPDLQRSDETETEWITRMEKKEQQENIACPQSRNS